MRLFVEAALVDDACDRKGKTLTFEPRSGNRQDPSNSNVVSNIANLHQ